jgi:N-acetyl-anhydromuramyl-L-alanine amidase AmpD
MGSITRVTVHHTATPRDGRGSATDAAAELRSIQNSHQGERGWADIGYHFLIDGAGRVWEGREIQYQGAHAGNREANRSNLGIALLGDFDRTPPTREQEEALVRVLRAQCATHGIAVRHVQGHNDVAHEFHTGGTSCPGRFLASKLPELVARAQSKLGK